MILFNFHSFMAIYFTQFFHVEINLYELKESIIFRINYIIIIYFELRNIYEEINNIISIYSCYVYKNISNMKSLMRY